MEHSLLFDAFIYLIAAVISVPIAARLGLGSVLGYLIAGIMIGPFVMSMVGNATDVMHFAEFGVVMMLFLVGLELRPSLLWRLKTPILGTGGLQVGVTTLVIFTVMQWLGQSWQEALAIGMILALSSTAIVLQSLQEKGLMKTQAGEGAFAVLLFQDIAVIPMLALLPLLAVVGSSEVGTHSLGWLQAAKIVGVIAGIIFGGRYLLGPLFRMIAHSQMREIFVAAALALVVGIAVAMDGVGLSPALGTFLAGVVLAESEYRHELESNIEPFKGLLLGLFFISVGASIDFSLLWQEPLLISALVLGLMAIKLVVLRLIGRVFRFAPSENWLFSCSLAQGGEFAFVLASFAVSSRVLGSETAGILVLVVALSMVLTPLLLIVNDKLVQPRFQRENPQAPADHIDENENPVIIAGFGRFGQMVGRLLHGHDIGTTILEHNANQIDMLRRYGFKVFFGDAARLELLDAAGAEQAKLLVVAVDEPDKSVAIVQLARKHFPHLTILARAIDRAHAHELLLAGVSYVHRETLGSAVSLGVDALTCLGLRANQAYRAGELFKRHDEATLREQMSYHEDEPGFIRRTLISRSLLSKLLRDDVKGSDEVHEQAWESGLPAEETDNSASVLAHAHKQNKLGE
jgi:glutathione-regulated potassium-efflux system protein KefB